MDEGNGTREPRIYVRFGPLPTQEIPIEWAERMLTQWCERQRSAFGKALAEVATTERHR